MKDPFNADLMSVAPVCEITMPSGTLFVPAASPKTIGFSMGTSIQMLSTHMSI